MWPNFVKKCSEIMIVYLNSFGLFCLHVKLSLRASKELENDL